MKIHNWIYKTLFVMGLWLSFPLVMNGEMGTDAQASSPPVRIAVAANFKPTLQKIMDQFQKHTNNIYTYTLSSASTAQLYVQIINHAPYDMFFAADQKTIDWVIEKGFGHDQSRMTYAIGSLILIGDDADDLQDLPKLQTYFNQMQGKIKIAIANPDTAPYGKVALEFLQNNGLYNIISSDIVRGNDIAHAFQFVSTRNANLALVAKSFARQATENGLTISPIAIMPKLKQDGVILKSSQQIHAAQALFDFIKSPTGQSILNQAGYE